MAHHIEEKMRVNLPANTVWAVLDDFGGIERYAPTIKRSPILTDNATGLGARRKCEFYAGGSLIEEIVDYKDGRSVTLKLTEHGMPVKTMLAKMEVTSVGDETTEVSMALDYVVKGGPLGWLLGSLILGPLMKGTFKKVMTGWAYHSATGRVVDDKLPPARDLAMVIAK